METEVILNLWYVADQSGLVLSLKGRAYVAEGTEKDKLALLHSRALLDYKIAQDFPVPEKYNTKNAFFGINGLYMSEVNDPNMQPYIFKEVINGLEEQFSNIRKMEIPQTPLIVCTPLLLTDDYELIPFPGMKKQKLPQLHLFDDVILPEPDEKYAKTPAAIEDDSDEDFDEPEEDEDEFEDEEDDSDEFNMYEDCVREKVTELFDTIAQNADDYNITVANAKLLQEISNDLSTKSISGQYLICATEHFRNGEMASCEIELYDDEITVRKALWLVGDFGGESQSDILYQSGDESTYSLDMISIMDNWCEGFEIHGKGGEITVEDYND